MLHSSESQFIQARQHFVFCGQFYDLALWHGNVCHSSACGGGEPQQKEQDQHEGSPSQGPRSITYKHATTKREEGDAKHIVPNTHIHTHTECGVLGCGPRCQDDKPGEPGRNPDYGPDVL